MINIWNLILNGLIAFITTFILPLFGDSASQAGAIGLATYMGNGAYVLFELIYDMFGSVVNLVIFAIWFGMLMMTILIKVLISAWLTIKRLIPTVG